MEGYQQLLCAFVLDLWLGDPRRFPHPVRWMGAWALFLENAVGRAVAHRFAAGMLVTLLTLAAVGLAGWGFLWGAEWLHPDLKTAGSIYLMYVCLATRSLYDESRKVALQLKSGNLPEARAALSHIVGRDTGRLDEQGVIRAAIETVSENTVDGIVAPLFYICLGGPVAGLLYKAVNTLDSLFGYRDERYERFGKFPARLDDGANWIPARLGGIFMVMAAWCCGGWRARAGAIMLRDGRKHASPNSGIPEAAMAGLLGVQLGGPSCYRGVLSDKPWIGDRLREPEVGDIAVCQRTMSVASLLALVFFILFIPPAEFH